MYILFQNMTSWREVDSDSFSSESRIYVFIKILVLVIKFLCLWLHIVKHAVFYDDSMQLLRLDPKQKQEINEKNWK